jgi:hypothetical protein
LAEIHVAGIATTATAKGGRPFGADPASFDFVKTQDIATGIRFSIDLLVFAFASACPVCDSPSDEVTSSAFVDPYFLAPPGYTVLLSPGIGNPIPSAPAPAIPEASTWIMLLAGFAGLGLLGCRASERHAARFHRTRMRSRLKSSRCTAASLAFRGYAANPQAQPPSSRSGDDPVRRL